MCESVLILLLPSTSVFSHWLILPSSPQFEKKGLCPSISKPTLHSVLLIPALCPHWLQPLFSFHQPRSLQCFLPATQRTARFPLGHTAQQHSQPRTDSVLRTDLGTGGMGGGFPMELSKGPVPCVARGVPMPLLYPAGHLHPAISSRLPPRGSNTWARCAGTWRTWRQTP